MESSRARKNASHAAAQTDTAAALAPAGRDHPPLPRNLAVQQFLHNGIVRPALRVGAHDDPAEAEADRIAARMLSAAPCACGGGATCSECRTREPVSGVLRKPRSRRPAPALAALSLGASTPLPAAASARFGAPLGVDLSGVRVHTGSDAAASADAIDARAFTTGEHIAFASGEYRPDTADGQRLLAHELAHVAQGGETVRREPNGNDIDVGAMCRVDDAKTTDPANSLFGPAAMSYLPAKARGSLAERVAAFKSLVLTAAVVRLTDNQQNLARWEYLVEKAIPDNVLAAMGLHQSGGARPFLEQQDIADPGVRELRLQQAAGRCRGGSGCHAERELSASRDERRRVGDPESWLSPNERRWGLTADWKTAFDQLPSPLGPTALANERLVGEWIDSAQTDPRSHPVASFDRKLPYGAGVRTGGPGYRPAPGSLEAKFNVLPSRPAELFALIEKVQPVFDILGPAGYRVLDSTVLQLLADGDMNRVRADTIATIRKRIADYQELIGNIRSGEAEYYLFRPIVDDLLPTADDEVRAVILAERKAREREELFWKIFGIAVLIAAIAAPFVALAAPALVGLVGAEAAATIGAGASLALGTAEVTLAVHGVVSAPGMWREGTNAALSTGANNVTTREMQDSAAGLKLNAFLGVVLAPFGAIGGLARMNRGLAGLEALGVGARAAGELEALPSVRALGSGAGGGAVERGGFLLSTASDGAIVATVAGQPQYTIILRNGVATLYESTGTGLRVIESRAVAQGSGLFGGSSSPFAHGPAEAPAMSLALPPTATPHAPLAFPPGASTPSTSLALPPASTPYAPFAHPSGAAPPPLSFGGAPAPLMLGPGSERIVWVNWRSGVYHPEGTQWFGRTQVGSAIPESWAVDYGMRLPFAPRTTRPIVPYRTPSGTQMESLGASPRGAVFVSASAQTERSMITAIGADVAESSSYTTLLQRGEYGLARPAGANRIGSDSITAARVDGQMTIFVNDAKYSTTGSYPVAESVLPRAWRREAWDAVAPGRLNLGDAALEAEIRDAFFAGRVQVRQLNVAHLPNGQVHVTVAQPPTRVLVTPPPSSKP